MGLADSKFKVTTRIRQKLLNDVDITAIVGEQIYPVIAPLDTTGDFIVYQRDGYGKERTKMGVAETKPSVYISAVSADYDRSQELAYLIDKCLDPKINDPDSDLKVMLTDSSEEYADEKYIQVLLFEIQ